jgi:hypothetical protein
MGKVAPELRAAAVEARRAGVPIRLVALLLDVTPAAVSYWTKQAGMPPQRPPTRCGVCRHPDRTAIEEALIVSTVAAVSARYPDLTDQQLDCHRRRHLGLSVGRHARFSCLVCDHPERELLDELLRRSRKRVALARAFEATAPGVTRLTPAMLRHHQDNHLNNPARDADHRLAAVQRSVLLQSLTVTSEKAPSARQGDLEPPTDP